MHTFSNYPLLIGIFYYDSRDARSGFVSIPQKTTHTLKQRSSHLVFGVDIACNAL